MLYNVFVSRAGFITASECDAITETNLVHISAHINNALSGILARSAYQLTSGHEHASRLTAHWSADKPNTLLMAPPLSCQREKCCCIDPSV